MIVRSLVLGWLLCAASVLGVADPEVVCAQPPATEGGPEGPRPLRFRRVYAAADLLEDLPREGDRLVPMPAEEFEQLVAAVRRDAAAGGRAGGVVSARYQARVDGDRLVDGVATLEIFVDSPGEVLVPVEPCGLAISEANWVAAEPRPAVLGLADDGRLSVLVSRRGRLRLAWSLAGRHDEAGGVEFALELPACGATQLLLDVPKGMTPLVEHGIATRHSAAASQSVRWRIELGGHYRARLRVVPDEQLEKGTRKARLRQSLVYDFSLSGVDVSAELKLDTLGEPLDEIALALDPGLQLVAAQYGTDEIPWTFTSPDSKTGTTRVLLQLPEPIQGTGRSLRLAALGPLVLDRPWRLPGIRPEQMLWQEGTASVLIPGPLALEQLDVRDGRQSKTGPLSGPRSGQRLEVQYFTPDASVEVVLSRPKTPIALSEGTALRLDGRLVTAELTAAMETAEGSRFEIAAGVGRRWIVDSVESVPADALDDWTVQRNGAVRTLRIRLAKPLSPARPVRLVVRARRLGARLGRSFTADDLVPLDFRDAERRKQLVWLRAPESYHLRIDGAEPTASIDPQALGEADLTLFAEPPRDPLFRWDRGVRGLRVFLEPQKPVYSATIRVEANVSDGVLRETYRLACDPQAARVQQVLVQFSEARDEPLRWTLGAENQDQLTARRLEPQQADAKPSGGESWLVELHPPRSVAFEIRASRTVDLGEPLRVSLACLPEAARQEATVVVASTGSSAIRIENHRLEPIPTDTVPGDQINPARASYRYDPKLDASPGARAALTVSDQPQRGATASAWAWECRIESRFTPDGRGRHLATYRLESTGRRQLRLRLPAASNLKAVRGVWVDQDRVAWRPVRDEAGAGVLVSLPRDVRYPVVAIHFDSARRKLSWLDSITPPVPEVDVPVLASQWTAWLPPGYARRDSEPCWLSAARSGRTWTKRLFGPLGRSADQPPFDPTRGRDWSNLVVAPVAKPTVAAVPDPTPRDAPPPWAVAPGSRYPERGTAGWSVCHMELPAGKPVRLGIVHQDTLRAVGWALLLGALSLAWWLAFDRPAVLVTAVGVLGVAALALPQSYSLLASSAVLGVLLTLGFRLIRRRREVSFSSVDDHGERSSTLVRAVAQTGVLVLAVALTLALCASAAGLQPEAETSPGPSDVYNVFIPVNDADEPTGDMVQVPETFYNELHRRAAASAGELNGWLLEAATYRGVLSWQTAGDRLVLDKLSATFEIRVFGGRSTVELPLGGEAVQLAPEGAVLDGRVVQPRWLEQGGVLAVDVTGGEPQSRLELSLRPTLQTDGTHAGFDLRIPPVANSRLELVVPADAPAIEVLSSVGPVFRENDPQRVIAQLGPSDRLAVRWPERGGRASGDPAAEVEELLWLKVQDGSAVLEGRFRYTIAQGYLSRLELSADPRLRLMPQKGSKLTVSESESSPGHPRTIRFELAKPSSEPVVLEAHFLLTETSGIGNLPLPLLAAEGARSIKRWAAVSVDSSLEASWEEEAEGLEPVSTGEFAAAWGPTSLDPQGAYALASRESTWNITTRPKQPQTTAKQSLALTFGEEVVEVDFSAQLLTTGGYCFGHRVAAPEDLEVEAVSLQCDSAERVARWSRGQDGSVMAFLTGPVSGQQVLGLRGRIAIADSSQMPLPVIRVQGAQTESGTIELFRRAPIELKVTRTEGLEDIENHVEDPDRAATSRLVRAMAFEGHAPVGGSVAVLPNRPRVRAEQTTFVRFDGEHWEAEVDLHVHVEQGTLDELRLAVPTEFVGPYKIDPPAAVAMPVAGEGYVIVRPRSAVRGDYRLRILSPLKFSPGDRVRAPRVVPQDVELTRHVLVLPTQLQLERTVWETQGLRPTAIPKDLLSSAVTEESFAGYRTEGPEFAAVLRPVEGIAQVHQADVRLAWQADGGCFGMATFDLEPATRTQCVLVLPGGMRLVAVVVAEVPVVAELAGENRWRVPLGPDAYPRRIDVLYSGKLFDADGGWRLVAPQLEGLPVRRTLWTVSAPSAFVVGRPEGLAEATWLEHARLRLEHARGMIELVAKVTSDEPDQARHWYRLWAQRFAELRGPLQRHGQQAGKGDSEAWAPLVSVDGLPPQVAALVASDDEHRSAAAGSPWSDFANEFWLGPWQARQPPLRWVTEQGLGTVTLAYHPAEPAWLSRRLVPSALLAVLTLLAVLGVRSGLAGAVFDRWPHAVGVAVGLAWWLWLWPSVLGLAIVAASLLASLRPGWKARRPSGSVIVPLSSIER